MPVCEEVISPAPQPQALPDAVAPTVTISASAASPTAGDTVTLTANTSGGGGIYDSLTYAWTGNGLTGSTTGSSADITLASAGTANVTVKVTASGSGVNAKSGTSDTAQVSDSVDFDGDCKSLPWLRTEDANAYQYRFTTYPTTPFKLFDAATADAEVAYLKANRSRSELGCAIDRYGPSQWVKAEVKTGWYQISCKPHLPGQAYSIYCPLHNAACAGRPDYPQLWTMWNARIEARPPPLNVSCDPRP